MNTQQLKDVIQQQVSLFLSQTGQNADKAKVEVEAFLTKIEPQLTAALEAGDDMSVSLLRDQVAIESSRGGIEFGLPRKASGRLGG